MSECTDSILHQRVEVKTWEREGGPPDTSKPPDTDEIVFDEYIGFGQIGCDIEPPEDGSIFVDLSHVTWQKVTCAVTWDKGYEVDPEIPHTKTYHAKETKTTLTEDFATKTYMWLNPNDVDLDLWKVLDQLDVDPKTLKQVEEGLKHIPH